MRSKGLSGIILAIFISIMQEAIGAGDCGISCTCDSDNECTICKESNYCPMYTPLNTTDYNPFFERCNETCGNSSFVHIFQSTVTDICYYKSI